MKKFLQSLLTCAALAPTAGLAQSYENAATVDVLPGWIAADGTHMAALRVTLSDGWKTYWRAPGDAGIPPAFDWSGSKNLKAVQISWPTPTVFEQNGLRSIGYAKELVLPIKISPQQKGKTITLAGNVDIGVCKDICIPFSSTFAAELPTGTTKRSPQIIAALADRPYTQTEAKVGRVTCGFGPSQDGLTLKATIAMPSAGGREFAVIETGNPQLWVAEAKTQRKSGNLHVTTEIAHFEGKAISLNRRDIRITVLGGKYAVDIKGCDAG